MRVALPPPLPMFLHPYIVRRLARILQPHGEIGKTSAEMCIEGQRRRDHNNRHLAAVSSLSAVLLF
ncbi:hypothetical protein DMS56_16455 [Klebsiella variicola]|nr:hypothetical protein DMS66_13785 [Klebsiella variicola]PXL46068.1 hypothetical protein DMS47_14310 [Klebsiella variicola]PXL68509.1 hypothetical protein DMS56_16455 [Klebsiella variicola]